MIGIEPRKIFARSWVFLFFITWISWISGTSSINWITPHIALGATRSEILTSTPTLPTIPDVGNYVSQAPVNALVTAIGICMNHRSYQPATSLGGSLDFGIEATVSQPPSNLMSTLTGIVGGSSGSSSSIIIPSAKVHLDKGITNRLDLGTSFLYFPSQIHYVAGTVMAGIDVKYVILQPEEGITAAVRLSYNYNDLILAYSGNSVEIKTVTISPQILISKQLSFADPYIGVGYEYTYGSIAASIPSPKITTLPGVALGPISVGKSGSGSTPLFFGGIAFSSGVLFKLTLEESYAPGGENYVGIKVGFAI